MDTYIILIVASWEVAFNFYCEVEFVTLNKKLT